MIRGATITSRGSIAKKNFPRFFSLLVPLDDVYPGTPVSRSVGLPKPISKTSTLSNGVKVVSYDTGDKAMSVGLFLNSGTRDESIPEFGSTLIMKRMAFKYTSERSSLKLSRDLQDAGLNVSCIAGREQMVYMAEGLPQYSDVAIKALTETITSPLYLPWEVKSVKENIVAIDLADYSKDTTAMLDEAIHAAAFDALSPLGHTIYSKNELPPEAFREMAKARLGSDLVTIAAVGVQHGYLVDHVGSILGDLEPSVDKQVTLTSSFIGGEHRIHTVRGADTYVALVFEGITSNSSEGATYFLLEDIIDIVGKAAHPTFNSLTASYSDCGYFALTGFDKPQKSGLLLENLLKVMSALASGTVSKDVFASAMKSAQIRLLSIVESTANLGTLVFDANKGNSITLDTLSKVNEASIKEAAIKMMKGKVAIAAAGDTSAVPRLDDIKKLI